MMNKATLALAAWVASAAVVQAGGIDRSGQSIAALFEDGNYAELSFGTVAPRVAGTASVALGGFASGDMAVDYSQLGAVVKMDLRDNLALALIFDKPFGADVSYPAGTGYYAEGTTAKLDSGALTLVGKVRLPSNISLIAGLRHQTLSAQASVPFIAGYSVNGARDSGLGYLLGIAYERPEIALRVALTYNSAISHALPTTEAGLASITDVTTPQSLNLEAQTGIAKDTLLFGSIRWVDWSAFVIDPANYPAPAPLVSYAGDYTTYTLGIGRRFNDTWSAAVTLGYEKPLGGFSSNLGPSDGQRSVGLGATYTRDNMKVTAGIRYVEIGAAQPTLDGIAPSASFAGNHALAFGLKVGFTF